jgi:hypothetical protein
LPEIEHFLAETGAAASTLHDSLWCDDPFVTSVSPLVPEEHPCITTSLEHFNPHNMCSRSNVPGRLSVAPAMQAIVVDRKLIIYPELTSII